jgi:arginyl-tRNA synthetase
MIKLKESLRSEISGKLEGKFPLRAADIEFNYPPQRGMGDLALTFPFELARKQRVNPRQIAQEVIGLLCPLRGVEKIELAGGGYVNLSLDRRSFFQDRLRSFGRTELRPEEEKIIIEHTNINPNKAAHIGHLRNACLGDTLGRCLKYKGEKVEIQNYIDDTGVQVVDVVFGFMELERKSLSDVERLPGKFDYYCWDLYARTATYLAAHPESQPRKAEILKRIEHGMNPEAAMASHISRRILHAHLATMRRLGVSYDVLPCESTILALKFWEKAFETLKEKKGISFVEGGENKGCWVMKLEEEEEKEKVIVRSDGTVTYVGKDIAYQLWKFGLLGKDFCYEPFEEEDGKPLWISSASPGPAPAPKFGGASRVYNVIDSRQAYLQKIVVQGLRALRFLAQAEKSIHFSYEMVVLSPKSLKELKFEVSDEDKGRAFLEVSGRKGLGVKADDLLDRLEEKARLEVEKRNPELAPDSKSAIARQIATGALRYFMLKYARNSLIVFDFDEALNFEGETGPYLQYTLVRLNSIFRKLAERESFGAAELEALVLRDGLHLEVLPEREMADFWGLVFYAAQFEEELLHSANSLEFSHLAKFAFLLCQKLNAYYHLYPVLAEENEDLKRIRILTIYYIRGILRDALAIMGIPQPEKM